MFEQKPLSLAVQRALSTVALTATAASLPIAAQAQDKLEEVVVTGTRITNPNLVTTSPVTTVSAEELKFRGITRVEDLLNTLPQVTPELSSTQSNGATGTATLDLRGLGSDRTLTLIDGHRMGIGDVYALAPDVNQVPAALIDHVEVLTGGASATYGSDAVAGVVNFIMKKDFEGLQVDYQYSGYQHDSTNSTVRAAVDAMGFTQAPSSTWDGGTHNIDIVMGTNSSDGKGNITVYLGYRDINSILQKNRDFSSCALADNTSCGGSATLPTGFFSPFDGSGAYYTVAGTQFVPWDGTYYNYAPNNYFQRPDKRYTAGIFGHYEINEHVKAYTEFQFMDDRSYAQIAPSGAFFVTSSINCDNPLLSAQQFATLGCSAGASVPWYIGRRDVEGGSRYDDLRHTSYRILGGLKGDINDDWKYDAFANFARTIYSETYYNDLSITRITRALDVVPSPGGAGLPAAGTPVCATVVNGADPNCVPWNIFQTGGVTQAAINYLKLPLYSKANLNQDQIVAYVSGDLTSMGIKSPSATVGVNVVAGFEYRDQSMDFRPDQGYSSGDGAGQGGATVPVAGSYDVKEFFMEAKVPIMDDQPFAKSLSADLAYRYSDYSTNVKTDTYKFAGEWTPVEGFKFRGGYSRAVRFGNLRELYEPQNLGLWGGLDPCAGATPTQTAAQCANSGVTAAQYGSVPLSPAKQYYAIFGGNPDLKPEKADTYTAGIVLTPEEYVEGLKMSVDYWDVKITGAINYIDPQYILNQCGLTGDAALCSLVHRAPNGNLWLGAGASAPHIDANNVNIGYYNTSGLDINGDYRMDVGNYGMVDVNFRGSYLLKFDQQETPGATVNNCAGYYGPPCGVDGGRPRPKWKHNLTAVWSTPWDVVVSGGWRYVGGVKEFGGNNFEAGSRSYFDLGITYRPSFIDFGETTISAGVTNLMDNNPPASGEFNNVAVYGNGNTIPATWDALGRNIFFGITQKF